MPTLQDWTLPGAEGQEIIGTTHLPSAQADPEPIGHLVICHGFKGYKDYGFVPYLAQQAAKRGLIAHRFNFSHSGMTRNIETFEKPELFEGDTWGKQILDLALIADAIAADALPGQHGELPMVWWGHSRGGMTCLLTAGRAFAPSAYPNWDHEVRKPAGLVSAAAPADACRWDEPTRQLVRKHGFIETPSSRTGQLLRVGRGWLEEIEADPDAFDPKLAATRIACPIRIVHGTADQTVAEEDAHRLRESYPHSNGPDELRIIAAANHVFGSRNPMNMDTDKAPEPTDILVNEITLPFCESVCTSAG